MKTKNTLAALTTSMVVAAGLTTLGIVDAVRADDTPPAIPATPAPAGKVLAIHSFELGTPYENKWRFDATPVQSGYIMVIEVDKDLAPVRQIAHPVLYVGNQVAEVLNLPEKTGRAVVLVPAELEDQEAADYLDLDKLMVFYGDPMLPEQVDAVTIRQQTEWAVRSGIRPVPPAEIAAVRSADAAPLLRADKVALLGDVAAVIRAHVPEDADLAEEFEIVSGLR